MSAKAISQDKKWEAESDARTLAEAHAIKADKTRMKNARKAAKKMLKEEKEKIEGLSMVAGDIDWDNDEQVEAEYKRRKEASA